MIQLYSGKVPNISLSCYCLICCSASVRGYKGFSVRMLPRALLISKRSSIASAEPGEERE